MTCCNCFAKMVIVLVVERNKHEHKALVCTKCGRTVSKDKYFGRGQDENK